MVINTRIAGFYYKQLVSDGCNFTDPVALINTIILV